MQLLFIYSAISFCISNCSIAVSFSHIHWANSGWVIFENLTKQLTSNKKLESSKYPEELNQ